MDDRTRTIELTSTGSTQVAVLDVVVPGFPERLPGEYIGVDIFSVTSGFLIT
jgi:peptidoglycan/LPS O-acetylase OafA/YrhL